MVGRFGGNDGIFRVRPGDGIGDRGVVAATAAAHRRNIMPKFFQHARVPLSDRTEADHERFLGTHRKDLVKLRMGLFEIFHAADIEPVFPDRVDRDAALVGDDALQHRRHIDPHAAFDVIERGPSDHIDAGADEPGFGRLFPDGLQIAFGRGDDAIGHMDLVLAHGHRGFRWRAVMEVEQRAVIDGGENIAVGDDHRQLGRLRQQAECAGGAQTFGLVDVLDRGAERRAVAEMI